MNRQKVTVLYVAGTGRSGSTLLGNVIGQMPGFFAAGEITNLFSRGVSEDWYCGCGVRFSSCQVWQAVLQAAFGSESVDSAEMIAAQARLTRVRHLPRLILSRHRPDRVVARSARYLARLNQIYEGVQSATGCRVVVDSSKSPSYGFLLGLLPSVDLRVVHLVRDPRGAAFSWQRKRVRSDGGRIRKMQTMSLGKSSALWTIWNLATEAFWRGSGTPYLRIRYEDFVANPAHEILQVMELLNLQAGELPFLTGDTVVLRANHTVSGNPNRLQTGEVTLAPDLEWTRAMPFAHRALVSLITAPSLFRYGYRCRSSQQLSVSRRL